MPKLKTNELDQEHPLTERELLEIIPCYECGDPGCYRYAPNDFENNLAELERWRCVKHGVKYHDNPEWDYFEQI
ncbi:MAG: hypothetical protein QM504_07815 [Pseudomonadota bacterium]